MISDMIIFMILYVTQLIVFASVGVLLFVEISAYKDVYEASKTLFNASLANYDFSTLKKNNKGELVGDVYLIVFIILNAVLLLNLLIAVLSSTYAMLEDKKLVLYINEILELRSSLEFDKNCSSLVSTSPLFNVIAVMFSPLIMSKENSQLINNILFHIEYIPILILITIVYTFCNLLLLPLAYFKGVYVTFMQI